MSDKPKYPSSDGENQMDRSEVIKLLSRVGHDMRSPLAVIQSYIHIIEMQEFKCSPEELREMTGSLQESIDKSLKDMESHVELLKLKLMQYMTGSQIT